MTRPQHPLPHTLPAALPDPGAFLTRSAAVLARGPVALIFAEDGAELGSTVAHHLQAGFRSVLLFLPDGLAPPEDGGPALHCLRLDCRAPGAVAGAVNAVIDACPPTTWLYYGYNAEYLFHPFRETRNLREMIAFHAEERRDAMLTCVIDLYPADLDGHPDGVALGSAMFDRTGYYALERKDAGGQPRPRQFDIYGGLRWRFEEHVPHERRRIDRIGLFRARQGLRLGADHLFSDPEYNTVACPWHHNLTACVMSFRAAKALRSNPASRERIAGFRWGGSVPFGWNSRQLMDLGLMEPGQWF